MTAWALAYAATLLVIGALDALWLGVLARDFYRNELAAVMVQPFRTVPAVLFYLGYPLGVMALTFNPMPDSMGSAVLRAALVGLVAYATYDLTNLATLQAWNWKLALVDTAWGVFLTSCAGAAAYAVLRRMA